jgi:arylsulfatase A-like enzyme
MNSSPLVVDTARPTLPSLLRGAGYATAIFGKWHLGFGRRPKPDWNQELKPGPLEPGFDHYFGIPVVNSHPPFVWVEDHRVVGLDPSDPLVYGGDAVTQPFQEKMKSPPMSGAKAAHRLYREEEHGTTLTEKATAWIRGQKDKPFFLYFATPHIHHPFTPSARFKGSSEAGRYGDFIQEFDWMVGELMRTLDELSIRDNTLVILTSDNGGMLNQGGQDAVKAGHRLNGNLLGFKFDAWEGGHRVPFLARWPGRIPAGTVSGQLICQVDMLATFAAITGAKLSPDSPNDSVNVLPVFTENPMQPVRRDLVISPSRQSHLALREGNWVYIGARGGGGFTGNKPGEHSLGGPAALNFSGELNSDVEDGEFRPDAPEEQLYDVNADPGQTRNIIRDHPAIAARMKARLLAVRNQKTP